MTVSMRSATAQDAAFLAWVMLTASRSHLQRGLWEVLLDLDERACLRYLERLAIAHTQSFCHYSCHLVAMVDEEPAAALCGYDPREAGNPTVLAAMEEVAEGLSWSGGLYRRCGPCGAVTGDCGSLAPQGASRSRRGRKTPLAARSMQSISYQPGTVRCGRGCSVLPLSK